MSESEIDWAKTASEVEAQDNLATANPIFVVQHKIRDLGYCDADWADGHEWRNHPNDFCLPESEEEERELEEMYEAGEDTGDWEKFFYRERWEFVQPFLTRVEAERYIESNRHNLNETRIFAHSGHRNREWASLRTAPAEIIRLRAKVEGLEETRAGLDEGGL